MNKLAAVNLAIEEVNKQAFLGTAFKAVSALSNKVGQSIVRGASKAKSLVKPVKPPVVSAGGAAASAAKPGLMSRIANNPYAIGTSIAAPMAFQAGKPPLP